MQIVGIESNKIFQIFLIKNSKAHNGANLRLLYEVHFRNYLFLIVDVKMNSIENEKNNFQFSGMPKADAYEK